jgi:hypothetical protein
MEVMVLVMMVAMVIVMIMMMVMTAMMMMLMNAIVMASFFMAKIIFGFRIQSQSNQKGLHRIQLILKKKTE